MGGVNTEAQWKEREKKFEDLKEYVKDSISGEGVHDEIAPRIGIDERQTQDYTDYALSID